MRKAHETQLESRIFLDGMTEGSDLVGGFLFSDYMLALCWPVWSFLRLVFLLQRLDNLGDPTPDDFIQEEVRHVCNC
jgi:hypothetical protein